MRTLLILAAFGWAVSQPWVALVGYIVLIVAAIVILWFLSVSIERRAVPPRVIDHNYVAALESMVVEADAEVKTLRGEIERLRAAQSISEPDPKSTLYGRVGLSASAPEWLVQAVHRAYRVQLHPDRHPAHRKREAERKFVLAEQVFDEIAALRV